MILFRTQASRLFHAALFFAAVAVAEQQSGPWKGEIQLNGAAYIPLESIRSFYKFTPLPAKAADRKIVVGNSGTYLTFRPDSCEACIGGYRCLLSHPAAQDARGDILISKADAVKLIDPILRPTYIKPRRVVRTVVIDPGHGGHDVGVISHQVREADITLLLARKLKDILTQRGLKVVLTRDQNHAVSDRQRIDALAQADEPVFISLHLNSGRSDTKGIETYSLQPQEPPASPLPGNATDEANAALSFCLQSALVSTTGAVDGACRRARFSLLSSATCPAAMVLVGYATHAEESAALNTEEYQNKLVLAIAEGISAFALALNPDAVVPVSSAPVDTTPPIPYKADTPPPPKKSTPPRRTGSKGSTKPSRRR